MDTYCGCDCRRCNEGCRYGLSDSSAPTVDGCNAETSLMIDRSIIGCWAGYALKPGENADGGNKDMYSTRDGCTSSILRSGKPEGFWTSASDLVTGDGITSVVGPADTVPQSGDLVSSNLL